MTSTSSGHRPLVVVTGGGSGIGRRTAEFLLERWPECLIAILDCDLSGLSGLVGDRLAVHRADVSDPSAVEAAFRRASEWAGRPVTHLVAAAGNYHKAASIALTPEDWHSVLGVHLDGTLYACQSAARQMIQAGGGSIVTFSSVAETFAWPARLPYAVAKAGISALTRTLAAEWAEYGIRVNAVAPGYVETPMVLKAIERGDVSEEVSALHALRRLGRPVEISAAVLFLLSDEASFVTGETMFVDGGFRAMKVTW
jgi:NAD(P)-dependent dehydrogenase (short-subunit alcohol dehydrogenase family)